MKDERDEPHISGSASSAAAEASASPALPRGLAQAERGTATTGIARRAAAVLLLGAVAVVGVFLVAELTNPTLEGIFTKPPIYGYYDPSLSILGLGILPAAALLIGFATAFVLRKAIPAWLGIAVVIALAVALAASVTLVRGDTEDLVRRVSDGDRWLSYASDIPLVEQHGVRGFAQLHPDLAPEFKYWNTRTHPPGPVIVLFGIFELLGAVHTLRIATAIAALGMTTALGAYLLGSAGADQRSAKIATALLVAAPGPLLLAYTSMDLVFAAGMSIAAGFLVISASRTRLWWAVAGGAVLGATTLMTFATIFVAVAATMHILVIEKCTRKAAAKLAAAAMGGLAVLASATIVLGFDLIGSFLAVPASSSPYNAYWIVGAPGAWFVFAGLPVAALGTWGLFRRTDDGSRPVFAITLMALMITWALLPSEVTKLRSGELERTWAFAYPALAASAAPVVNLWMRSSKRFGHVVLPALMAISIAQAVLIQVLWDTLF